MKSVVIASLIALSATAAQASQMDVHCTAGDAVITAELNVEGRTVTGTVDASGAGVDFKAPASGSYIFYPAGSYYKFDELEVIEFWATSGKDSVAFKSVRGEKGSYQQTLLVNKKTVEGTCVVSKE